MNILFYGNCQLEKLIKILNLCEHKHIIQYIECFTATLSDIEFDTILKSQDIIITQPICDNYRNMYYLSSSYVVNNCAKHSKIIFVNNCHFDFYYFDLQYNEDQNNQFSNFMNYIHGEMLNSITNNGSYEKYCDYVYNNEQYKSYDELIDIFNNNIANLENRYNQMLHYSKPNTFFISFIDFIKSNYKQKLLFYTFNHPSKYLLQFIANEIIKILGIENTINMDIDPFDFERYILYSCLQKMVYFNINEYSPYINNKTSIKEIYNIYQKLLTL
jgi:hypothetical protein